MNVVFSMYTLILESYPAISKVKVPAQVRIRNYFHFLISVQGSGREMGGEIKKHNPHVYTHCVSIYIYTVLLVIE